MKILALIVVALWLGGGIGYWRGMHGPANDDFGSAAVVWLVLILAFVLTLVLLGWAVVRAWP